VLTKRMKDCVIEALLTRHKLRLGGFGKIHHRLTENSVETCRINNKVLMFCKHTEGVKTKFVEYSKNDFN